MGFVKPCTQCGEVKHLADFPPNRYRRDGRQSYCRDCLRLQARERRLDPAQRLKDGNQAAAYRRALARLRELHRDDFARLYDEEMGRIPTS